MFNQEQFKELIRAFKLVRKELKRQEKAGLTYSQGICDELHDLAYIHSYMLKDTLYNQDNRINKASYDNAKHYMYHHKPEDADPAEYWWPKNNYQIRIKYLKQLIKKLKQEII